MSDIKLALARAMVKTAARFSPSILDGSAYQKGNAGSEKKESRVITLFSTKGGVGKTVIATNLAVYWALQNKNVCLVDLDLQFGDVGLMLKIEPRRNILDALQAGSRLDKEMISNLLLQHDESGLRVLLAPVKPDVTRTIEPRQIANILHLLRELADIVIVDMPSSFDQTALEVIDASDKIMMITSMDLPSIKSSKVAYGLLEILNMPPEKVELVLNRADTKVGLELEEIERSVGKDISWAIPSDRAVPRSINLGVPFIVNAPRSDVSKSFEKMKRLSLSQKVEVI